MTEPTGDCKTCGNSWSWHQEKQPIHPFNDGRAGATSMFKSRKGSDSGHNDSGNESPARAMDYPIDPVLRVALINKGVITPEDLRNAEEVIRATTAQFEATVKESRRGQ